MAAPLTPSDKQVGKLEDRLMTAARKRGITSDQFQIALGYPGTGLEDEIGDVMLKYAKKASGIVTPRRAEETGLVPANWCVKTDRLEGDVDLAQLDYGYCPVHAGETYTGGDTMLERAATAHAIGSLGFVHELLKAQEAGKEIFPVESRGKHYFVMPMTVLLVGRDDRRVACFGWGGGRWVLYFFWIGDDRFDSFARLVRVREAVAATAKTGE